MWRRCKRLLRRRSKLRLYMPLLLLLLLLGDAVRLMWHESTQRQRVPAGTAWLRPLTSSSPAGGALNASHSYPVAAADPARSWQLGWWNATTAAAASTSSAPPSMRSEMMKPPPPRTLLLLQT